MVGAGFPSLDRGSIPSPRCLFNGLCTWAFPRCHVAMPCLNVSTFCDRRCLVQFRRPHAFLGGSLLDYHLSMRLAVYPVVMPFTVSHSGEVQGSASVHAVASAQSACVAVARVFCNALALLRYNRTRCDSVLKRARVSQPRKRLPKALLLCHWSHQSRSRLSHCRTT